MAPLFYKGQRVGSGSDADRWQIVRKLGEGAFAEVYECRDTFLAADSDARFAMKVEKRLDCRSVRQEHRVMKRIAEHCPQICPVLHGGTLQQDRYYMVLQLLGVNLVELRRSSPGGRLEAGALRQVAGGMLDALQAVHSCGFIHRDVKPANFAQVLQAPGGGAGEWRLLDFGLARRFTDDAGALLPARPEAAFRGSTTYASVHAHAGADLGRRDDLWSWLYCLVELAQGTLPWRQPTDGRGTPAAGGGGGVEGAGGHEGLPPPAGTQGAQEAHRAAAAAAKQAAMHQPERLLTRPFPAPLLGLVSTITSHLSSLSFADTPDYGLLRRALAALPDAWAPAHLLLAPHPPAPSILAQAAQLHASSQPQPPLTPNPPQDPADPAAHADAGWAWTPPPAGTREAAAVSNATQYLEYLQAGAAGPAAERLAQDLATLHPADAMAVLVAALGAALARTPPGTCHALSALLADVAVYASHASAQAAAKFAAWQQQQQQQQAQLQQHHQQQQQQRHWSAPPGSLPDFAAMVQQHAGP